MISIERYVRSNETPDLFVILVDGVLVKDGGVVVDTQQIIRGLLKRVESRNFLLQGL